jgi:hypothetical protein
MEDGGMHTHTQDVHDATAPRRLYRRELPGAGFVCIDLKEAADDTSPSVGRESSRLRVYVERRATESRRVGHEPPVLAEYEGDDFAPALGELYRMASDNVALARALLDWQSRRQKSRSAD